MFLTMNLKNISFRKK